MNIKCFTCLSAEVNVLISQAINSFRLFNEKFLLSQIYVKPGGLPKKNKRLNVQQA